MLQCNIATVNVKLPPRDAKAVSLDHQSIVYNLFCRYDTVIYTKTFNIIIKRTGNENDEGAGQGKKAGRALA
jgi:hypothetical protein